MLSGCATARDCPFSAPRDRFLAAGVQAAPEAHALAVAAYAFQASERANTLCWSSRGDRYALFALGVAAERGIGGPSDVNTAKRFYERAARSDPGTRTFYAAPVGGRYGTPISLPVGPARPGLPEARAALERLAAAGAD